MALSLQNTMPLLGLIMDILAFEVVEGDRTVAIRPLSAPIGIIVGKSFHMIKRLAWRNITSRSA